MLRLAIVPSVVLLIGMIFMPISKTTRWLVNRGRDDDLGRSCDATATRRPSSKRSGT
jgi:hypothetical protein